MQKLVKQVIYCLFILSLNLNATGLASLFQTKTKLKDLDTQISKTKDLLLSSETKRDLIGKELATNEKAISQALINLSITKASIADKQKKISSLEQQISQLNNEITSQQQELAVHVVSQYKMGSFFITKLVLNQEDPYALRRLLSYHSYIVKFRKTLIEKISQTNLSLNENQNALKSALANQQNLQRLLQNQQEFLEKTKKQNLNILSSLENDIKNQQVKLQTYQHNKKDLAELLKSLLISKLEMAQAFATMKHKLPKPLDKANSFQKMNQGLTFFAKEGTPVHAVHSGKVVFSDWLNGYGLLVIIDHGQNFMTLYAHNESLFIPKGSMVKRGEQIATVGHSGGIKQNGLYFEVRQSGKAVPPLDWLA